MDRLKVLSKITLLCLLSYFAGVLTVSLYEFAKNTQSRQLEKFWELHDAVNGYKLLKPHSVVDKNDKKAFDEQKIKLLREGLLFEKDYSLDYLIRSFDFTIEQVIYFREYYKPGLVSVHGDGKYSIFDEVKNRARWDEFFAYLNSNKIKESLLKREREIQ